MDVPTENTEKSEEPMEMQMVRIHKKRSGYWTKDNIRHMSDPRMILQTSENCVCIKHGYPKSQCHFLVLPKAPINDIYELEHEHLSLLEEMLTVGMEVLKNKMQRKERECLIGFGLDATMERLKMHFITKDFISDCFKRHDHWSNYNTRLFMPYRVAYGILKVHGKIDPLPERDVIMLRNDTKLRCNQCTFNVHDVRDLKKHLLNHWYEKNKEPPKPVERHPGAENRNNNNRQRRRDSSESSTRSNATVAGFNGTTGGGSTAQNIQRHMAYRRTYQRQYNNDNQQQQRRRSLSNCQRRGNYSNANKFMPSNNGNKQSQDEKMNKNDSATATNSNNEKPILKQKSKQELLIAKLNSLNLN